MLDTTGSEPAIDEVIWRDWVQRGKRRENAAVRKRKIAAGIIAILLAAGSAIYALLIR